MRLMRETRLDMIMISAASIVRRHGFVSVTCASVANECTRFEMPTSVSLVKHYYGNRLELCRALARYAVVNGMQDITRDAARLGFIE